MNESAMPHGQKNVKNINGDEMSLVASNIPTDHEMMVYHTMAEQAVNSKMYKGIGEKSGVMMIMLAARELGVPPMQALNRGLNIINGTVEISARMLGALIRRAGHQFIPKKLTDTECIMWGKRADNGQELEVSFTFAEAQKAGLVKPGGGWVKWPKDMLFARSLSRLARQLFSDVIGIGYVEGEIKECELQPQLPVTPCVNDVNDIELDVKKIDEPQFEDVLLKLDDEDKFLMMKYLHVVVNHFGWSEEETKCKFSKDPNLMEKFEKWKEKQSHQTNIITP